MSEIPPQDLHRNLAVLCGVLAPRIVGSETDDLPIGEVRKLRAPYALEAKDAEIARCEELWKAQWGESNW